jgi:hypothetical protein
MKSKKQKSTTTVGGLESDQKPNSKIFGAVAVALAALGIGAVFLLKGKSKLDVSQIRNNRQNRTEEQMINQANDLRDMYRMHGISLDTVSLLSVLQEFIDLEQTMHSHAAMKQIETRLAQESGKGFQWGSKYGLYGIEDLGEVEPEPFVLV